MSFNYAQEKRKFDKEWKEKEEWYKAVGMNEEAIQGMYSFDLAEFNSRRAYENRTQEYPDEYIDDDQTNCNSLFRKFETMHTCFSISNFSARYSWVEDIDNPSLVSALKNLKESDIELLTLVAFDGYGVVEIAAMQKVNHSTISRKLKRLEKYLKNFLINGTD